MASNLRWIVAAGLLCTCIASVNSSNILLFPYDHGSHVRFFSVLGEALSDAGHDVSIFVSPSFSKLATKHGLKAILPPDTTDNSDMFTKISSGETSGSPFNLFYIMSEKIVNQVKRIFAHNDLMEKLSASKFDLTVIDGFDCNRANYLVPYALDIPYMTLTARQDPWSSGLPSNAALEGVQINVLYGDTTIFERLKNVFFNFAMMQLLPNGFFSHATDDLFTELVPQKPNIGFSQLYRNSEMFLVNLDVICLDFHRISAPHYQFVSMLGVDDAKVLPKDIEDFVSGSKHGFILMTFGSGLKTVQQDILAKLLEVLGSFKQNVMIRHEGDVPAQIPKNIRITSWIPQSDILGHPNTKLFITHSGNNGQQEAVFHGVPMLMFPFFGDQFYNSKRSEIHKFGLTINPKEFTVEELRNTVEELLTNPVYAESIKNCSRILRSLPNGADTSIYWIEHVLKFGGAHLKPYYMDMPLYKYLMIDIFCVLSLILVIVLIGLKFLFKLFCKCFSFGKMKPKQE